jgi:hypothetical protein
MDATNVTTSSSTTPSAYDEPYRFGRRPTARAPFPFTQHQFARLLILRGRVQSVESADDQPAA